MDHITTTDIDLAQWWQSAQGQSFLQRLSESPSQVDALERALRGGGPSEDGGNHSREDPLCLLGPNEGVLPFQMVEDWSTCPPSVTKEDMLSSVEAARRVLQQQVEEAPRDGGERDGDDERRSWDIQRASQWTKAVVLYLSPFAVARLLQCRFTKGSPQALLTGHPPMANDTLIRTFNALHCPTAKLTVGARALSKHLGRDGTHFFWGRQLHGSEESKNAQAAQLLEQRILPAVCWRNVYMLPHNVVTFEVRVSEGYGARWVYNNSAASQTTKSDSASPMDRHVSVLFRGFLEPHDPNGHECGWQH
jgi:hypothetical protein